MRFAIYSTVNGGAWYGRDGGWHWSLDDAVTWRSREGAEHRARQLQRRFFDALEVREVA